LFFQFLARPALVAWAVREMSDPDGIALTRATAVEVLHAMAAGDSVAMAAAVAATRLPGSSSAVVEVARFIASTASTNPPTERLVVRATKRAIGILCNLTTCSTCSACAEVVRTPGLLDALTTMVAHSDISTSHAYVALCTLQNMLLLTAARSSAADAVPPIADHPAMLSAIAARLDIHACFMQLAWPAPTLASSASSSSDDAKDCELVERPIQLLFLFALEGRAAAVARTPRVLDIIVRCASSRLLSVRRATAALVAALCLDPQGRAVLTQHPAASNDDILAAAEQLSPYPLLCDAAKRVRISLLQQCREPPAVQMPQEDLRAQALREAAVLAEELMEGALDGWDEGMRRLCTVCSKNTRDAGLKKMKRCARCNITVYCSASCQVRRGG
jgi:hypothetical protein